MPGHGGPGGIDVIGQALRGQVLPVLILGGYPALGLLIYATYGLQHSTLRRRLAAEPVVATPGP